MRIRAAALLLVALAVAVPRVLAHHTVANTHDITSSVALTGVVTSVEWKNPHVIYHLAVAGPAGVPVDWEIESRHLQGMRQDGIAMDTIQVGDAVTMHVMLARDGSHHAATASVTLPNGRTVRICTATNNSCP
jgi:hypothetical protein